MQEETIREFSGKIIGYIETDAQGNKTVRNFYRQIVGRYDANAKVTRDFYGRIVAKGDVSTGLLYK